MTIAQDAPWIACIDRKQINGILRELYLWDEPLTFAAGSATQRGWIHFLDEPEDAAVAASRIIMLQCDIAPPLGPIVLSAQCGEDEIQWDAQLLMDGGFVTTPFPNLIEIRRTKSHQRAAPGHEVVSVFCRSGAITAPYIRAQKEAIRSYARSWPGAWPRSLVTRHLEREAEGRVIGHVCAVRVADRLVMVSDVARTRPSTGSAAGPFMRDAIKGVVEVATAVEPSSLILIGWSPQHPLWADLDRFLSESGSTFQTSAFSTLYTRFDEPPDARDTSVVLSMLSAMGARRLIDRLSHAGTKQLAYALGIGKSFDDSKLAEELALIGERYSRAAVLIRREGQSVGLALFPGLPSTWNLRKTCTCVWLFPFDNWKPDDRSAVYQTLRTSEWVEGAPGVLEITPVDGDAGTGKWLDWRIIEPVALLQYDGWGA